jgi:hypothetical protein
MKFFFSANSYIHDFTILTTIWLKRSLTYVCLMLDAADWLRDYAVLAADLLATQADKVTRYSKPTFCIYLTIKNVAFCDKMDFVEKISGFYSPSTSDFSKVITKKWCVIQSESIFFACC